MDLSVLFYNLAENFAGVVQYNNVNRDFLVCNLKLYKKNFYDIFVSEERCP